MSHSTDRNLLFGILALQMDFVDRERLIEAMNAWVLRKSIPLGSLLEERGALSSRHRALLDDLVDEHVSGHGGDPRMSLAALPAAEVSLATVFPEPAEDVRQTLAYLKSSRSTNYSSSSDPERRSERQEDSEVRSRSPRFTILKPHAEGGLGKISVALDRELNRRVAFKEIKHERHAESPEVRARFVAEAEITGKLEHPGVVPVYSLGEDDRGRPFYAMRFVQGVVFQHAIDRYHDPDASSSDRTRELLNLLRRFLDVCDVVAFAHRKGVLHRDIKPENVLLGEYGETIVVDWGIAKIVSDNDIRSEPDTDLVRSSISCDESYDTKPGSRIGTPGYMSPEQAEGDLQRVGPRSDVYSLGATLYAVLTGRPPFADSTIEERLAKTLKGEFPRPRELKPESPRALEAVCVKALSLSPEDRYGTVKELSEDVERFLADEPISVYRDPLSVKLRRWTRRNKTAFAASLGSAVIAVIGLAATAYLQREASIRERALRVEAQAQTVAANSARADAVKARAEAVAGEDQARHQARKARFVADFLLALFQSADPIGLEGRGFRDGFESIGDLRAVQLLERGAKRLNDPALAERGDPLAIASFMDAIGHSMRSMGEYDQARPLIEGALKARRERLPDDDPELAESYFHLAILMHDHRDFAAAEVNYRKALSALSNRESEAATGSRVKFRLAWMLAEMHRFEEAEALFQEVLRERSSHSKPDATELQAVRLGLLVIKLHDVSDRSRIGILLDFARSMPVASEKSLPRALLGYLQADGLRKARNYAAAVKKYEEILAMAREFLPSRHMFLAFLLGVMAGLYRETGDFARAESLIREAFDIGRRVMPTHPYMIDALAKYSDELVNRGRDEEAERYLVEAVGYARKRAEIERSGIPFTELLTKLVHMKEKQGRPKEAEAYRERFGRPDSR